MKNNIKKSIKYLLLFALAGTLFIIYILPSIFDPTFERLVTFYGEIYLSVLFGSLSVWWTVPNVGITFKLASTILGFIYLTIWAYKISNTNYPSWKLAIPVAVWIVVGLSILFVGAVASI